MSCRVPFRSVLADLLRAAELILWDEAPMMHRHAIEAVDRTLRDLTKQNARYAAAPTVRPLLANHLCTLLV